MPCLGQDKQRTGSSVSADEPVRVELGTGCSPKVSQDLQVPPNSSLHPHIDGVIGSEALGLPIYAPRDWEEVGKLSYEALLSA